MFYGRFILYVTILAGVSCSYGDESVHHVTVERGHTAELICLDDTQMLCTSMSWLDSFYSPLTVNDTLIVDNEKMSASKLGRKWYLTIREVNISDSGCYICTFYCTDSVVQKEYKLSVFVPPKIAEDSSSPDVEAVEGTSVHLFCNATGYPTPNVTWTSRHATQGNKNCNNNKVTNEHVPAIRINNVSRCIDEIYTCTASNGFGSSASRDIRVRVRFKPSLKVHRQRYTEYKRGKVTLSCSGQGYNVPNMYFAKNGLQIFDDTLDQSKYRYTKRTDGYNVQIILDIYDLEENDFGCYK